MHSDIDWNDLRHVLAAADHGSLAAAARALGVSHTTVLRRIAAFEERLGVRLFERLAGGLVPTASGEELVGAARAVDETVLGVERRILGRDLRLSGTLRVTTTDTLAVSILPPHLAAFRAAHPDLELELGTSNQLLSLSKRDADVAIRPSKHPPESLVGRRVAEVAFAPYAAPAYTRRIAARDELERHLWVAPDDSLAATSIARWMARALPRTVVALRCDSLVSMRELAAAGVGVAALPCYLGDRDPRLRRIRPAVPEMATELWLLVHEDLRRTARIRAFLDFMARALDGERELLEGRRPRAVHRRT